MRFRLWVETIVHEDEHVRIRDAEASDIPELFTHKTEDVEDILAIQQQGFNLRKFGQTSRRFRSPAYLTEYDPKGVYATAGGGESLSPYDKRPYVVFRADINKALVLEEKTHQENPKQVLSELYGGKTGAQLRNALMKDGYQAVLRPGSEQIILDPSIITIVSVGNTSS